MIQINENRSFIWFKSSIILFTASKNECEYLKGFLQYERLTTEYLKLWSNERVNQLITSNSGFTSHHKASMDNCAARRWSWTGLSESTRIIMKVYEWMSGNASGKKKSMVTLYINLNR